MSKPERPLRILALDGGGVRGLSEVLILKFLMLRLKFMEEKRLGTNLQQLPEPWMYFDLICGTSTGGILALMLGRLRMPVPKCLEAYRKLSSNVFEHELQGTYRYDVGVLEENVREILRDVTGFDDLVLLDERDDSCKTFVVAKRHLSHDSGAVLFKTYRNDGTEIPCTIAQAARATSALPTYFPPAEIDGDQYVDGGITYNNPAEEALREARRIWPTREVGCLVSIGTGLMEPISGANRAKQHFGAIVGAVMKGVTPVSSEKLTVAQYCTELATSCQMVHLHLVEHPLLEKKTQRSRYYRFNVTSGMSRIGLHESKELNAVSQMTDAYLRNPERKEIVSDCVELLCSDDAINAVLGRNPAMQLHGNKFVVDEQMSKLLTVLSSLSFDEKHRELQLRRMEGLGQWLLHMDQFVSWYEGPQENRGLWCHGAPGAGKTFLTSVVIDYLRERSPRSATASRVLYFYFDYRQQSEQTPFKVLTCLLRQLLSKHRTIPEAARTLHAELEENGCLPNWEVLVSVFVQLCSASGEVFLVLDALDECDENLNRGPILNFLGRLMRSSVRIFITSRPHSPDINEKFTPCQQITIEATEADVRAFLYSRIAESRRMALIIDNTLREEIVQSTTKKACGTLLVPALQIGHILSQTSEDEVRDALNALPTGLIENLDLTMERIRAQDRQSNSRAQLALRTLMWLSHVKRPLTVDELRHALGTPPGTLNLNRRKFPQAEFLTEACVGLVTIDDETSTIRLVHQSVNEYLQDRREALFPEAHGTLATHCLVYLLLKDFQGPPPAKLSGLNTLLSTYSFLDYAACFWGEHAAVCFNADAKRYTHELLSNNRTRELWCIVVYRDRDAIWEWAQRRETKNYVVHNISTLHFAAEFGIEELAVNALNVQCPDPNPQDSDGQTPMMRAAASGKTEIIKLLASTENIEFNLVDSRGNTALCHAVRYGDLEDVQFLLSCPGVDINLGNPLSAACENYFWVDGRPRRPGRLSAIAALLLARPDFDVNVVDPSGAALWETVTQNFDFGALSLLLSREEFDPSLERGSLTTTDLCNYLYNGDIEAAEGLLNRVLLFRTLDQDHRFGMDDFVMLHCTYPTLYYALSDIEFDIEKGYVDVDGTVIFDTSPEFRRTVRQLLESHGCTLDMPDSKGRTYLHSAAHYGREAFAAYLIERGADINCRDLDGSTPLQAAVKEGSVAVQMLLNYGADASALDNTGRSTVALAACLRDAVPTIVALLEHGAAVNAVDKFGNTPLHEAVWYENFETVDFLMNQGAALDGCSTVGTPLHIAAHVMNEKLILHILSRHPDLTLLDCFGRSGFDYIQAYDLLSKTSGLDNYSPTPPAVTRSHILDRIRNRTEAILNDPSAGEDHIFRLGMQLLLLGDENSARVAFDTMFTAERNNEKEPMIRYQFGCNACYGDTGLFYVCTQCFLCIFCSKFVKERPQEKYRWCRGHHYLEVPSKEWKGRPKGIVNDKGQNVQEWIRDLHRKYSGTRNVLAFISTKCGTWWKALEGSGRR